MHILYPTTKKEARALFNAVHKYLAALPPEVNRIELHAPQRANPRFEKDYSDGGAKLDIGVIKLWF